MHIMGNVDPKHFKREVNIYSEKMLSVNYSLKKFEGGTLNLNIGYFTESPECLNDALKAHLIPLGDYLVNIEVRNHGFSPVGAACSLAGAKAFQDLYEDAMRLAIAAERLVHAGAAFEVVAEHILRENVSPENFFNTDSSPSRIYTIIDMGRGEAVCNGEKWNSDTICKESYAKNFPDNKIVVRKATDGELSFWRFLNKYTSKTIGPPIA
jgi:hypothetical protein